MAEENLNNYKTMDDVVTGRIAKLSGNILFVNKNIIISIQEESKSEIKVGDFVVGYNAKINTPGVSNKFKLIAKTNKQKVNKSKMMKAIISFVKLNRNELGIYTEWRPLVNKNIFSKKRNENLVLSRQLFMFLNRFITNKTLQNIAKECNLLGLNSHATVIHGEKQILNNLSTNPSFAAHFQSLVDKCIE